MKSFLKSNVSPNESAISFSVSNSGITPPNKVSNLSLIRYLIESGVVSLASIVVNLASMSSTFTVIVPVFVVESCANLTLPENIKFSMLTSFAVTPPSDIPVV